MELVVKGRNVEVPDHYRVHVAEKMARIERYDTKVVRYDIELLHERNPRQSKVCQRVEITGHGRGPVIRAEARGPDFYAALDTAINKLENRLRRNCDRRKVHYGRRHPQSVHEATAALAEMQTNGSATTVMERTATDTAPDEFQLPTQWAGPENEGGPGQIVRTKDHSAAPMTVDQALYQMELVGHDFYLFTCADSGRPSVVYRRRGFDYGVIRLV